jgi:hypothetical protein
MNLARSDGFDPAELALRQAPTPQTIPQIDPPGSQLFWRARAVSRQQFALAATQVPFTVHKSDKMLHQIQDGLNLYLNR